MELIGLLLAFVVSLMIPTFCFWWGYHLVFGVVISYWGIFGIVFGAVLFKFLFSFGDEE